MKASEGLFSEQRLELPIEDFTIVGIPDVIHIKDGVVSIVDWKTSKKGIRFKSNYDMAAKKTKKMKFPLTQLDDVNGQHYTL